MLGDNTERARSNPLRKARKRRNAKMVQFAEPIYYAASEHDYSSDDDASPDDMEFITTAEDTTTNGTVEPVKENVKTIATNIAPMVAETAKSQEAPIEMVEQKVPLLRMLELLLLRQLLGNLQGRPTTVYKPATKS